MGIYTFYFKKKEFDLLVGTNIDTQLNVILGDTWENALCFFQQNDAIKMEPALADDGYIIGFTIHTEDKNVAGISSELLNFLNCKFIWNVASEEVEEIRKEHRVILQKMITG